MIKNEFKSLYNVLGKRVGTTSSYLHNPKLMSKDIKD